MRVVISFMTIVLCVCFVGAVVADQIAITEDGRKVKLKDDGTWEYVKPESLAKKEFHFRKTRWGMIAEEVRKSEKGEPENVGKGLLGYKSALMGMDCLVGYIFVENRLVRAKYIFIHPHANRNLYLSDRLEALGKLKQKYGEPVSDNTYWSNDLFRDDPGGWGTALGVGHLSFYTAWKTDETDVVLLLEGDNYEITFVIQYSSKNLKKLEEKARDKKVLDDL